MVLTTQNISKIVVLQAFLLECLFLGENNMPIKKVKGGYKWGDSGKVYKKKEDALKQGRAIEISKKKRKKRT